MCGLAGILRVHRPDTPIPPHHEAIPEAWLDILDESIRHRGPDGAGRFRDRATRPDGTVVDVALVHRRLSIIDHAGGAQPMVHVRHADGTGELLKPQRFIPDPIGGRPEGIGILDLTGETNPVPGRVRDANDLVAVAFNGCIYNHRELRAELEGLGHRFETDHSDTEVLVHGWREWGKDLRQHLDAMHVHLTWVRSLGAMMSGSDRTGEKPLYSDHDRESTVFVCASSAVGLIRLSRTIGLDSARISNDPAYDWIMRGAATHPPLSLEAASPRSWGAWPTKPGEWSMFFHASGLPARGSTDRVQPFRTPDDVIDTLETSIRHRLDADVPTGVFLSGGVDSGLIAALSADITQRAIKAYTVRMPVRSMDEADAAARVALHVGIEHEVLDCATDPATDLVRLIEQLGLPFGDSSLLPSYWVANAARREIKVALGGDGGDELFGGYRRHQAPRLLQRVHPVARFIPTHLIPQRNPRSRPTELARLIDAAVCEGYADLQNIFTRSQLNRLLVTELESTSWDFCDVAGFDRCDDPLREDFEYYLCNDILRKSDAASMSAPIELRSPFLANRMIGRAFATPLEVLMPRGERKGLLKQVARRYLPPEIVDRPKRGFAIPIGEWFRTDYGSMRQLLYDHLESADPFPGLADAWVEIKMDFVRQMLREHDAAGEKSINPWHGRDHSQRLYMLLVLSIWAKWLARVRSGDGQAASP